MTLPPALNREAGLPCSLRGRAGVDENLDVDDPGLDRMLELIEFVAGTALDEVGVQGPGAVWKP